MRRTVKIRWVGRASVVTATLEDVTFKFSGHESFPFRYTWMHKAVQQLREDPAIFRRDDATLRLGVGKNMVRSIRHWALALGIAAPSSRKGELEVTELGERLFGQNCWDPYLEDIGTLWLLHWQLAHRPHMSSTWFLVFNRWNQQYFMKDRLTEWLFQIAQSSPGTRATLATIKRDVDVFVRTYRPSDAPQSIPVEDTFDCPLAELNLLDEVEAGLYTLMPSYRTSLPLGIFAYSALAYWSERAPNQNTLTFESIHLAPGSPGQVFRLVENDLAEKLEKLPGWIGIHYDETAGRRVLIRRGTVAQPLQVLDWYYKREVEDGS